MAVKKKKVLTYKDKPVLRVGKTIYYGDPSEKYILVLDILDDTPIGEISKTTKVSIKLMDNTGELGKGKVFRQSERENLYKAFDIGAWWLQAALTQ